MYIRIHTSTFISLQLCQLGMDTKVPEWGGLSRSPTPTPRVRVLYMRDKNVTVERHTLGFVLFSTFFFGCKLICTPTCHPRALPLPSPTPFFHAINDAHAYISAQVKSKSDHFSPKILGAGRRRKLVLLERSLFSYCRDVNAGGGCCGALRRGAGVVGVGTFVVL